MAIQMGKQYSAGFQSFRRCFLNFALDLCYGNFTVIVFPALCRGGKHRITGFQMRFYQRRQDRLRCFRLPAAKAGAASVRSQGIWADNVAVLFPVFPLFSADDQTVSALTAEKTSGEPATRMGSGLSRMRGLLVPGFQPQLRTDQSFVGGQYQTLSAVGFRVQITAIGADKILRSIADGDAFFFIIPIQLHVRSGINRIGQHPSNVTADPESIGTAGIYNPFFPEHNQQISQRYVRISIGFVEKPQNSGFFRRFPVPGGSFSFQQAAFPAESEGNFAAHVKAFFAAAMVGIADPLLNGFPFQLGKNDADVQHSPANGGGSVEFFRAGHEFHPIFLKFCHQCGKVQNGTAASVQLVADDPPDAAFPDLAKHLLELGPVCVFAAVAPVGKDQVWGTSGFIPAEFDLTFDGNAVCLVHGLPGIDGIGTQLCGHGIASCSAAMLCRNGP